MRHPDLRKVDVAIRYEKIHRPKIESIRSSFDIALDELLDWESYPLYLGKIIDITVDGEVFTRDQLLRKEKDG